MPRVVDTHHQNMFQEGHRRSWRRPIRGVLEKLKEGHDDRKKRRELKLELKSSKGAGIGKEGKIDSRSSYSIEDKRSRGNVFVSRPESTRGRVDEEGGVGQEEEEEEDQNGQSSRKRSTVNKRKRNAAPSSKGGTTVEEDTTTKRKRRALRALWGRVAAKLGGGDGEMGIGRKGRGKAGAEGEVEMRRLGMLKELKGLLAERHGDALWSRAKATQHELNDALLMRYTTAAH